MATSTRKIRRARSRRLPACCLALATLAGCATPTAADRSVAPPAAPAVSRAYTLFLQADQERKRGNLDRAGALLEQAATADPRSATLRTELAGVRLEQGDARRAQELLNSVLAEAPNDLSALTGLAAAKLVLGERADAIELARRVTVLAPAEEAAALFFAAVLLESSRGGEACEVFRQLVANRPGSGPGLAGLGRCHEERGETGEARACLQRSVAAAPERPDVWALLGKVLEDGGEDEAAAVAYRRAVDLDARHTGAQVRLWELYRRTGRPGEAEEVIADLKAWSQDAAAGLRLALHYFQKGEYRKALDLLEPLLRTRGDDTTLLALAADLHARVGNSIRAIGYLERLLVHNPGRHDARLRLGRLYRESGRNGEALQQFRIVITNAPRIGEAYVQAALTLATAGREAEALGLIGAGLEQLPGQSRLLYHRGLLLDRSGDAAGAECDFRESLRLEPKNAGAGNALGYLYARQGVRLDEAVTLIAAALETDPGNPGYLDSLGWALFRRGEADAALEKLGLALEKSPGDAVSFGHLGEVCRSLSDPRREPLCRGLSASPPSPPGPSSGR